MRPPQGLAYIDITKTGNQPLIEKSCFERGFLILENARHISRRERIPGRLHPHFFKMLAGEKFRAGG